jgi:hypothetical protein
VAKVVFAVLVVFDVGPGEFGAPAAGAAVFADFFEEIHLLFVVRGAMSRVGVW